MRVTFDVDDILDGLARSVSGSDMNSFREAIFDWLSNNDSREIAGLNDSIETLAAEISELKDENASLRRELEEIS